MLMLIHNSPIASIFSSEEEELEDSTCFRTEKNVTSTTLWPQLNNELLRRRRTSPYLIISSCTLDAASRWGYNCSQRRKKMCFTVASLAQPQWGLMVSHWGSVEFWVTAQPQATAGSS
ncbi:hypothetical protein Q8A73_021034 [Channa argus]|nr:hypothetical protein Q8A73_021034 [Channa argus]